MEFKYTLTESEMVSAMRLHGQGNKAIRIMLVTLGLLLLLFAAFVTSDSYLIVILIGAIAGYFVIYFFVIPYQAKKQFRELKSIQSEMQLNIDPGGIHIESSTGSSDLDWSHFKKWAYNKNIIILYITSRMFYMLPRRVIENEAQLNSVLNTLTEHLGKNV